MNKGLILTQRNEPTSSEYLTDERELHSIKSGTPSTFTISFKKIENMKIGILVKKYRKERGVSQAKLAKDCGVSESYISLIESNHKKPDVDLIERICLSLNTHPSVLFYDLIIENYEGDNETLHELIEVRDLIKLTSALS